MVKKSIFIFFVFFCFYTLYIHFHKDISAVQNQNQQNIVKTENYFYSDTIIKNVIIGSSLAARLKTDSLPNTFNLSFAGLSILDGLALIQSSKKYPEKILVETNVLTRDLKKDFISSLTNPVSYNTKKYFLSLRNSKQPIGILAKEIQNILKSESLKSDNTQSPKTANSSLRKQLLIEQLKKDNNFNDTLLIKRHCEEAKNYIDELLANNVEVILFKMPVNQELTLSKKYLYTKKFIDETFPKDKYKYIPDTNWNFETTDGLHLNGQEALIFTKYLKSLKLF